MASEEGGATAAVQVPEGPESSTKEEWEIQRDHEKQQGDEAFRLGAFKTAIDRYTQAIALDPDFLVAYSNRSAAYLKNSEKSKALRDAEKTIALDPHYAKGYSRLAAALHALKRWEQAKDAYHKVLELDAENSIAKKGIVDCQNEIDRYRNEEHFGEQIPPNPPPETTTTSTTDQVQNEEVGKDDDSLNEFFEEVEEVTANKPTKVESKPSATNNVKNEKVVLGTAQQQMDRLLQNNYEWRNLNPFYVMQLPHTATEDEIAIRYKALSLLLHPDKNGGDPRAQQAFDIVKKARSTLLDEPDRARHARMLVEEGFKQANTTFKKNAAGKTLEEIQEIEVMRIFAQVEQKRREVEDRERKFEQRTQQQEDAQEAKERQERQFDKSWRKEERVDKRVGNWRDFASKKKRKL